MYRFLSCLSVLEAWVTSAVHRVGKRINSIMQKAWLVSRRVGLAPHSSSTGPVQAKLVPLEKTWRTANFPLHHFGECNDEVVQAHVRKALRQRSKRHSKENGSDRLTRNLLLLLRALLGGRLFSQ
jgi:hypothetical protein